MKLTENQARRFIEVVMGAANARHVCMAWKRLEADVGRLVRMEEALALAARRPRAVDGFRAMEARETGGL